MRYPHPWLAAVAAANVWLAAASLLLTLAVFQYQPSSAGWYGSLLFGNFSLCPTRAAVVEQATEELAAVAAAFAPPVAWLLAARLLRSAAAGRATLAVRAGEWPLARLIAPVGLWLAALAVGLAAWRWAEPGFGGPHAGGRIEQGLNDCVLIQFRVDAGSHRLTGLTVLPLVRERCADPVNWGRRFAVVVGYEARMLLAAVTPGAVLFCLCGVVCCAGRPDPDA